jgi:hypothetical protein
MKKPRKQIPLRDMMAPEAWYQNLDKGIRFAVRVLHANGFETCQSCRGGRGHPYAQATVEMISTGNDSEGFGALAALQSYGLPVDAIAIVWPVQNGLPFERLWRITFSRAMEDRANDKPMFVYGYRAQP